jgi:hypothetical protein
MTGVKTLTNDAGDILRAMLGIQDPVSIKADERRKQSRSKEFFNSEENDLIQAYDSIPVREKLPHFDSLFEFLINVRRYANAYQKSGELWKVFGDYEAPQLVNIQMDAERHTGNLAIARFTREKLVEFSRDPRQKMWADFYLPRLDSLEGKIMILLFTDDEMSQVFGFPFDIMLTSEPNNVDEQQAPNNTSDSR